MMPEQEDVMRAYVETCYKVIEEMQPGKTLGEVAVNVNVFVQENGWGEWMLPASATASATSDTSGIPVLPMAILPETTSQVTFWSLDIYR